MCMLKRGVLEQTNMALETGTIDGKAAYSCVSREPDSAILITLAARAVYHRVKA